MKRWNGKGASCIVAIAATAALCVGLAACSPQANAPKEDSVAADASSPAESNDTVVLGDLDRYDPEAGQKAEGGASLGFDEESNLQQEKTAGFSGGAVQSNLEPLGPGITDYGEDEPVGMYATTGEPKVVPHGSANGIDCLSCHATGEQQVPASHVNNSVANEQCTSCHVIE